MTLLLERRVCYERPDGLLGIGGLIEEGFSPPLNVTDREGITWTLIRVEPRYIVYKPLV